MAVNDLALSWKDHHGVLISVFEKLLEKKSLVDCTLAAEGKYLKAHKIVLSACSPYLEALLNQENDKHPIIFLRDVRFEDLKTLVEFVYSGEIKIPEDRLMEFLSVAEALQIKGLGGPENENLPEKSPPRSESLSARRKESCSPLPRKRPRHHSNEKEDKRQCKRESSPDVSVIEPSPPTPKQQQPPQSPIPEPVSLHCSENQMRILNVGNAPSPSTSSNSSSSHKVLPPTQTVTEEIIPDVRKIKEEVLDHLAGVSVSVRSVPEEMPRESQNEEILGLRPEFEEVTFKEDYSEMLPEDDNNDSVINQNQPSSSREYTGFPSGHVDTSGMDVGAQFLGDDEEKSASEGPRLFSVDPPSEFNVQVDSNVGEDSSSSGYLCETREASIDHPSGRVYRYEKKFQCPFCPKRFEFPSTMNIHMAYHTGNKPYQCPTCSAKFAEASKLRRHIRTHTGERPYQCTNCGKGFTQTSCLKVHMRSQTCQISSCPVCRKSFKCLSVMQRHLKEHSAYLEAQTHLLPH